MVALSSAPCSRLTARQGIVGKMLGTGLWNKAKRPTWSWRVATILWGGISRMEVSHVLDAAARRGGPARPGLRMGDTMKCE